MQLNSALSSQFDKLAKRTSIMFSDYSVGSLEAVEKLERDNSAVIGLLKSYIQSLEAIAEDCACYKQGASEVLDAEVPCDEFVRALPRGMLSSTTPLPPAVAVKSYAMSFGNRATYVSQFADLWSDVPPPTSKPRRMFIKAAGCSMVLDSVASLVDIPQIFWHFAGDDSNAPGVYCRISQYTVAKVSFPPVLDATTNERTMSVRCRYGSREECVQREQRRSFYRSRQQRFGGSSKGSAAGKGSAAAAAGKDCAAGSFVTVARKKPQFRCKYAHTGESFVRMGDAARCSVLSFGDRSSLRRDLESVTLRDVKTMLLASLHDAALVAMWYDCHDTLPPDVPVRVLRDLDVVY